MPPHQEKSEAPLERLTPRQEAYLKASKEIVVKFIESGRLGAAGFQETFGLVYRAVRDTVEERD
ncbi:MAG: hypothetical protein V1806_09940 [Pseudomonadota bacterium]